MSGSNVCPPPLNTDIGGIGIRISFYLQALFLAFISAKLKSIPVAKSQTSKDMHGTRPVIYSEVIGSLYILVGTNISMSVITFFLGFKSEPEITLNDAIVVLCLVGLSSIVIFDLTAKHWHSIYDCDGTLACLSIIQYYLLFSLTLAVFIKADNFGARPDCNVDARIVIFKSIVILPTGRIISIVSMVFITGLYTWAMLKDLYPKTLTKFLSGLWLRWWPKTGANSNSDSQAVSNTSSGSQSGPEAGGVFSGRIGVDLICILGSWTIVMANTELLIRTNRFEESEAKQWQFSQILALSLVIFPLKNMIEVYRKDSNREAERLKNEKESV